MPRSREQNTVAHVPNWNPAMHICLRIAYCRSHVTTAQLNNGQERQNTTARSETKVFLPKLGFAPLPSGFMNLCRRGGRKIVTPRAVEGTKRVSQTQQDRHTEELTETVAKCTRPAHLS